MSEAEDRLIATRALRDTARATLAQDWATLRDNLSVGGITGRLRSGATRRAADAAGQVKEIALANRGTLATVVGVGALALAGWIFRASLAGLASEALTALTDNEDEA